MPQDNNKRARNPKADPRLAGTQKQRNLQKSPEKNAAAGGRESRSKTARTTKG